MTQAARSLSKNELEIPRPTNRSYVQGYVPADLRQAVDAAIERENKGLKAGDKKITMTEVIEHGLRSYLRQADPVAAKRLGIE